MGQPALQLSHSSTWLEAVLEDFTRHLARNDLSPNTIRIYSSAIGDLFVLMRRGGMRDIRELDVDVLEVWQDQMKARGMKPRSRSLYIIAVRQLIKWAAKREYISLKLEDALSKPRVGELEPRPIAPADLAKLKAYLFRPRRKMRLIDWRDRALFAYLLASGARVSEALQVRRDDYVAPVVRQKGGSRKTLLIPPEVAQMVADYVSRRRDSVEWLWVTLNGRPLRSAGVREIWAKLALQLGLEHFTTHQIRHTTATELFEADVPDAVISKHLGHKTLQMLSVYRKVREASRQKAVDAMSKIVATPPAEELRVRKRTRRASWARLKR